MSEADPRSPRTDASRAPAEHGARERILDAAIRSFAEEGYAGTTTAGVARAAGVTQPLVHHYFSSKDGLWRAAIDRLFEDLPAIAATVAGEGPPAERFLSAAEQFVRLSAARPEILRVLSREGAAPGPRLTYILDAHVRAPFERSVAALREAQEAGLVSRDLRPELLLFFILGAGGHLFDVPALAKEAFGLDVTSGGTRDAFVGVFREVLRRGALREEKR
jgi:AcrR family transcriptional regulator